MDKASIAFDTPHALPYQHAYARYGSLMAVDLVIPHLLRTARQRAHESVASWAQACGVGLRQYRRYESGETRLPPVRQAALFAHAQRHVIHRLPANTQGRDFVVGDLHGHRTALLSLLAEVDFNPAQDRIFSVGDLVDRGPDSFETLRLLQEPWFYAVRGNHEDMLLDFAWNGYGYGPSDADHAFLRNGGDWLLGLTAEQHRIVSDDLLPRTALLPHIHIVGTGPSRFHVVHAELNGTAHHLTDAALDTLQGGLSPDTDQEFIDGFDGIGPLRMRFLWGRSLIHHREALLAPPDLSPTFCGHTPVLQVGTHGGHTFLDTGAAYLGGDIPQARLTLIEVLAGRTPSVPDETPFAVVAHYSGVRASA